ncbi:MAG: energy transducer TonB [Bacteroidales bacterium]|jgi:TonB family protein|nr:energy transducer TonB [Bacteroidales bacterium]MDD4703701.1 energy transducer TonB [Bacteroidales bacterium]MDX9797994.1 energy transducer TonB [Bacteroidales bacterium]
MKVKTILSSVALSIALTLSFGSLAQQNEPIHSSVDIIALAPMDKQEVSNFIYANLVYPSQEIGSGIEGMVVVQFIVEKDGSISNLTIEKSLSPLLDQEAKRVIALIPGKWIPAKINGTNVRSYTSLPVLFSDPERN